MNKPEETPRRRSTSRTVRLEVCSDLLSESTAPELGFFLLVVAGEGAGRRVEVTPAGTEIGRSSAAGIQVAEPAVSSHHCRVHRDGERVLVEDLDSTNGTWIDGRRVRGSEELPTGSVLQVGRTGFRLELRSSDEVLRAIQLNADLEKAAAYVRALLPGPRLGRQVNIDWVFRPSEALGGDALGYADIGDTQIAIYLLDVCGHGVGAALHSVAVINSLRMRTLPGVDFSRPAEVLAALNRSFAMEDHGGFYFTIWYGVLETSNQTLRYSSAGHPPAMLLRNGSIENLGSKNPAIGLFETASFRESTTTMIPGDQLFVFSDGVFEVTTAQGVDWSLDGLRDVIRLSDRHIQNAPRSILSEVESLTGRTRWDDDVSILAIHWRNNEGMSEDV